MKLAVALLLAPAAAYVPLRASMQRASTLVRADEEPEAMDLDLGEMFELFDEADPEGVAEREAAKKAEEEAAVKELKDTAVGMVSVPPAYAAFYGPGGCVTTYKGPEGTCIMQTNCAEENMEGFTYGLMCVDGAGEQVRHVFMGDAFDAKETFDTLIPCSLCLGLDTAGSVGLGQEVGELKDEVKALAEKVEKLEGTTETAAPATTTAAPADADAADATTTAAPETTAAPATTTAAAAELIHKAKKMSKTNTAKATNDEVEVDVIHHDHKHKQFLNSKRVKLSSHTDWDPISARLKQPTHLKRGQHPAPGARWLK